MLSGREGWRRGLTERILPVLRAFHPTLLLLSAGFDGAKGDEGCEQDGVGGLDLRPDDFSWLTRQLLRAVSDSESDSGSCNKCAIVSVLEGGYGNWDAAQGCYNRASLQRSCAAHIGELAH